MNNVERFELVRTYVPDFVLNHFYDSVKHSDNWFLYCEGNEQQKETCAKQLFETLIADCNRFLSVAMVDEIIGRLNHALVVNEVSDFFGGDEEPLSQWQAFESHLERNERSWAMDEKMAMYANEY